MKDKVKLAIAGYVMLRDQRDEIKKKHSDELAPLMSKMLTIEGWLQRKLLADGLDSFKKKGTGTAYLAKQTRVKVEDWDSFYEFVKAGGHEAMLEHRASKSVVEDYIESCGDLPPGLSINSDQVVRVRRG